MDGAMILERKDHCSGRDVPVRRERMFLGESHATSEEFRRYDVRNTEWTRGALVSHVSSWLGQVIPANAEELNEQVRRPYLAKHAAHSITPMDHLFDAWCQTSYRSAEPKKQRMKRKRLVGCHGPNQAQAISE
jgi:hypothetical protein